MGPIPADVRRDEPLAPRTTLGLGGAAEFFLEVRSPEQAAAAVEWARAAALPVHVLGGGSNLIIPDAGVRGLTLSLHDEGEPSIARWRRADGSIEVPAGLSWDAFVAASVDAGLAGVECLSGIPGRVGAVPIQNVGAYGQDVSETIVEVGGIDLATLAPQRVDAEMLGFAYRDSALKRAILRGGSRLLVTSVRFRLEEGGGPARRYAPLQEQLAESASLADARALVLSLRRQKSMVFDLDDPDSRSAGSFFTNPIVSAELAAELRESGVRAGFLERPEALPAWEQPDGRVKLAAAWLIERAGFPRGSVAGNVGQSRAHALALINRGGASASELLAYAARIVEGVRHTFGVSLEREPRVLGVDG